MMAIGAAEEIGSSLLWCPQTPTTLASRLLHQFSIIYLMIETVSQASITTLPIEDLDSIK